MRQMIRATFLLLLMAFGQAETALAVACEPQAAARHDHTPCASRNADGQQPGSEQGRAPHDEAPGRSAPHDGPSCAVMLACGAGTALPSLPVGVLPTLQATAPFFPSILPPPSRAETPGNPPPRA
jgi:hypothetical protein